MRLIDPDPRIVEHSAEMARQRLNQRRRDRLKQAALTIIPILISFLALVVSIIGLLLPGMEQVGDLNTKGECQQCNCQHVQKEP